MKNMKKINCNKLSFEDCEMTILRMAVNKAEENSSRRLVSSADIKHIIEIVENFIRRNHLICYGGTAINNILPPKDQFYDKSIEIPDYDFFSAYALNTAIKLADEYYEQGFQDVEAKAGQHHGTFKVYVNYIPVADITQIPPAIFNSIKMDAITVHGILYAPPNFLRMSMYLELSRPDGDTSRWEKVLFRLNLLNKNYPLTGNNMTNCDIQRTLHTAHKNQSEIFDVIFDALVDNESIFFGSFATSVYIDADKKAKAKVKLIENRIPDFDVISNSPKDEAYNIKSRLEDIGCKHVTCVKHDPIGEVIPLHYEIKIGSDTVAFLYKPLACHSYNKIHVEGYQKLVYIATIDTMLSFYLAFLYSNQPYHNAFSDRILCMCKIMFDIQKKHRVDQSGVLRRFSIDCYGQQETIIKMREHKAQMHEKLLLAKHSKEYQEWFLNYVPAKDINNKNINNKNKKGINKNKNGINKHSIINKNKRRPFNKTFNNKKKYMHNRNRTHKLSIY